MVYILLVSSKESQRYLNILMINPGLASSSGESGGKYFPGFSKVTSKNKKKTKNSKNPEIHKGNGAYFPVA